MLWKFLEPCFILLKCHWVTFLLLFQPHSAADTKMGKHALSPQYFLCLHLESKKKCKCISPEGECSDYNTCIFQAPVRSCLLNNCHYWCLWHCYLWVRTLENNGDKAQWEKRKKKSHYLLKRHRKGSKQRSKWGKTDKKKAQVSIFIHIKSLKLHICIPAQMCCCAVEWSQGHSSVTSWCFI